ncbi:Uncharacterized protein TCAP_02659 [Tolypocladium capitatum]|uniref:DUF8212 domain-containing protein n=1 Tax=Tolypocladium capitatum TaxID=45235 RepID=A0A2K3QIR4_9HYPO|nr:Uncharacterized protein TCAP_02659 [Tolypocladium capitatum]
MRLLDARTLGLVDVRDDAIPRYAILSHTWGDEEITIQELRRIKGRVPRPLDRHKRAIVGKQGFVKSSSAELSEAINSMYIWYRQSAECYAFLSDVQAADKEDWSLSGSSLRRSRWFTRGWTLQELIAPKAVLFYAKDWTLLGHKDSPLAFANIISQVTGIDDEVLDGRIDPLQLSVSARMAWAAHRHTTRLEDTAYSLMGLFQVNMPLLYGEGHRAFTRLQEEIIQSTDDQSLFAWNSFDEADQDPDALFGLLAQSPAYFKDARNIQPLPPLPIYASAPSSITNHGLRVQVYLRPVMGAGADTMEEDYLAILDCFIRVGDLYKCPVVRLRRLSEDQYARLQPKSQMSLPPPLSQFAPENEGYRAIYVRQRPVYYHLPQFRISPFHMESGVTTSSSDGVQYRLTDTFPPSQWNSNTMTLKAAYSRKLRAMGVFRFQSVARKDEGVDVVVGLRRLNSMQWEGWCFQLSRRAKALEATFTEVNGKIEKMTAASHADLSSGALSSGALRDALGDDSSLMSNATVEGIQLQGRLYISVLVSPMPEIQTTKELLQLSPPHGPVHNFLFHGLSARVLTEPCFQSSSDNSEFLAGVEIQPHVPPVRARPPDNDGMISSSSHFMKPIYDFLVQLRERKREEEPGSPAHLLEDLAIALFDCDPLRVEEIVAKGPDMASFTSDKYGFAPLHWAVAGGSVRCIHILLDHKANLLGVTEGGLTALHVSALCNTKVWSAFTSRYGPKTGLGELGNMRTKKYSDTPLHLAAAVSSDSGNHHSFFQEFMEVIKSTGRVGLFTRNKDDETSVHRAAANNNGSVIRALASSSCHYHRHAG